MPTLHFNQPNSTSTSSARNSQPHLTILPSGVPAPRLVQLGNTYADALKTPPQKNTMALLNTEPQIPQESRLWSDNKTPTDGIKKSLSLVAENNAISINCIGAIEFYFSYTGS